MLTALLIGVVLVAGAQRTGNTPTYAFTPGWYFGAHWGANIYLAEGNNFLNPKQAYYFALKDNTGFMGRVGLGYDFSPVFGVRGMLGSTFHYWPDIRFRNPDGSYRIVSFGAQNFTGDAMFNMSNLFGGYNPNRLVDLSLYAGAGLVHRDKSNFSDDIYTASGRGGLQADFRLARELDLNVMIEGTILGDNYNDYITSYPLDIYGSVSLGITYRLGSLADKLTTARVEPGEPKLPMADNKTVKDEPVAAAVEPQAPVQSETTPVQLTAMQDKPVEVTPVPVRDLPAGVTPRMWENVFYSLNQRDIVKERQKAAVARVVEFLNSYPEAKIVVNGYADRGTGTPAANNKVSRERAERVVQLLVKEYGIPADRIETRWHGDRVQLYKQQDMNRLTTMHTVGARPFEKVVAPRTSQPSNVPVNTVDNAAPADARATSSMGHKAEVSFGTLQAAIAADKQKETIMMAAVYLRNNPGSTVVVAGYADKSEPADKQVSLSKARAVNVSNELILNYSIDASRIQVKWYGAGIQPKGKGGNSFVVINTL